MYSNADDFIGSAHPATDQEIDTVAAGIGVPPAAFRAVIAVEAAGKGFDNDHRPKALFERHHFFKQTNIRGEDAGGRQTATNICHRTNAPPFPAKPARRRRRGRGNQRTAFVSGL